MADVAESAGVRGPLDPFVIECLDWEITVRRLLPFVPLPHACVHVVTRLGFCLVCLQIGWLPYPPAAGVVVKHFIEVLYTEVDDSIPEEFEVPGNVFKFTLDEYHKLPIDPDEEFKCVP